MKKYLFILFFFWGGCYSCPEVAPFWNLKDFKIEIKDIVSEPGQVVSIIENDTLTFALSLESEFVADNIEFSFFNNQLYALDCLHSGWEGMSDPIIDIKISSEQDFKGIEAGALLNDSFSIGFFSSIVEFTTIEDLIANSKNWIHSQSNYLILRMLEVPEKEKEYTFTIKIEMESGIVLEKKIGKIKWI